MNNSIDYCPYVIFGGIDYKIKFYYKYFVLLIISSNQISILLTQNILVLSYNLKTLPHLAAQN